MTQFRILLASFALSALPFARAESSVTVTDPTARQAAPHRASSGRPPAGILAAIDTDRNGVLSAAEIANAPIVLKALDSNDDGVLSPAELRGISFTSATPSDERLSRASRRGSSFNVVFTLDANHDGDIQTMEIVNAVSSLKTLDKNHDGELTPDELQLDTVAPRTMV